jgi:PadR family transcriptional regulator, regulatory protein PadR
MSQLQQVGKGSTPLLILSTLAGEKMYGYQIMRELERRSTGYFTMTAALLYPALHQLEKNGLLESEWQDNPGKRRRKYYTITSKGRKALVDSQAEWRIFVANLFKTLESSDKVQESGA